MPQLETGGGHGFRFEPREMRRRRLPQIAFHLGMIEQVSQALGQSLRISIWKYQTAGSDCFLQSAAFRSYHNAAAGDSFQGDNSKRLGPARWDHQHAMAI